MKSERIHGVIMDVDNQSFNAVQQKNRGAFLKKFGAIVICLCLIALIGACSAPQEVKLDSFGNPILRWSKRFSPEDYFKYSIDVMSGESVCYSYPATPEPYADMRLFDERAQLEAEAIIPILDGYPLFNCVVFYNEDGSIFSLGFGWNKRGKEYSNLGITVSDREVEQVKGCVAIYRDEDGNIVDPPVTVTERDAVYIMAGGNEHMGTTITFQNESGWYQIEGSSCSYEDVVTLLDWFWKYPVDFERFPIEAGISFTHSDLEQNPDAFAGYIPDFAAFGFSEVYGTLSLRNDEPYSFQALYRKGTTDVTWYIKAQPDYYELQESLGEFDDLTWQIISEKLPRIGGNFAFIWNSHFIKIYSNSAPEVWALLETLR